MKNKPVISLLKKLIKINSENPFSQYFYNEINAIENWIIGGNETEIASFLIEELNKNGFKVSKQFVHKNLKGEEFYNIIAEKGNGKNSVLFYGHMDTVTSKPWLSFEEAHTPKIVKRSVYGEEKYTLVGLGSNDMKAGLAVILEAFKDIDPKDYKIKVAFGVDEEFYSLGGNILAKSDFMNDVKAVIVPEIGDGPNKFYGTGTIGIGRLGRCEYIIDVYGTGGHGAVSYRDDFINAAIESSKIVFELERLRKIHEDKFTFFDSEISDKESVNFLKGSFFVSKVESGNGSLSIPAEGKIVVDFTFTPNYNPQMMLDILNEMIDKMYSQNILKKVFVSGEFKKIKVSLKERPTPISNAFLTGDKHPFTKYIRDLIEKDFGFKNYNMGYSVADENIFAINNPNTPVLVLGPTGENSHKDDEWVEIDSVIELEKLYRNIAINFSDYLKQ